MYCYLKLYLKKKMHYQNKSINERGGSPPPTKKYMILELPLTARLHREWQAVEQSSGFPMCLSRADNTRSIPPYKPAILAAESDQNITSPCNAGVTIHKRQQNYSIFEWELRSQLKWFSKRQFWYKYLVKLLTLCSYCHEEGTGHLL